MSNSRQPVVSVKTSLRQAALDPLIALEAELIACHETLISLNELQKKANEHYSDDDKELLVAQIHSALSSVEGVIDSQPITLTELLSDSGCGVLNKELLLDAQRDSQLVDQMLHRYCCVPSSAHSSSSGSSATCLAEGKTLSTHPTPTKPQDMQPLVAPVVSSKEAASARFLWSLAKEHDKHHEKPLFAAVDDLARNFLLADLGAERPDLAQAIRSAFPQFKDTASPFSLSGPKEQSNPLLYASSIGAQSEVLAVIQHQNRAMRGQAKEDSPPTLPKVVEEVLGCQTSLPSNFPKTLTFCRDARAFIRYDPILARPHRRPTNSAVAVYYALLDALYRDTLCMDFVLKLRDVRGAHERESGRMQRTEGWMLAVLKPIAHTLVQYHTVLSCDLGATVEAQISALRRLSSSSAQSPHPTTASFCNDVDGCAFEFAVSPFHCSAIFEAIRDAGAVERDGCEHSQFTSLREDQLEKVLSLEEPLVHYETLVGAVAFLGPMVSEKDYFAPNKSSWDSSPKAASSTSLNQGGRSASPYAFLWDDATLQALLGAFHRRVRYTTTLLLEAHSQLKLNGSSGVSSCSMPSIDLGSAELLPTLVGLGRIAARTIDQLASVNALPSALHPSSNNEVSLGEDAAGEDLVPITLEALGEDAVLSARLQGLISLERSIGSPLFKEPSVPTPGDSKVEKQFSIPKSLRRSRFYCPVSGAFMPPLLDDPSVAAGNQGARARNHPRFLTCGHVIGSKALQSLTQFSRQRTSGSHPTVGCPYCTKHSTPADSVYLRY